VLSFLEIFLFFPKKKKVLLILGAQAFLRFDQRRQSGYRDPYTADFDPFDISKSLFKVDIPYCSWESDRKAL